MAEWKPGDVVVITSGANAGKMAFGGRGALALLTDRKDRDNQGGIAICSYGGKEARPLVVIDPEDREQVERLSDLLAMQGIARSVTPDATASNLGIQRALRSLITPPKPDEPTGLGAVVEDAEGLRYVHAPDGTNDNEPWTCANQSGGGFFRWADVPAVKVLSKGVTP